MFPVNDPRLSSTPKSDDVRNKQRPLVFHLPDGDIIEIYPIEGVIYRFELNLHPILDKMDLITNLMKRVNSRMRHWHYVYGVEGEWGIVDQDRTLSTRDRHPFTHPLRKDDVPYSDTVTAPGNLRDFWLRENERVPLSRKNWSTGYGSTRELLENGHENYEGVVY